MKRVISIAVLALCGISVLGISFASAQDDHSDSNRKIVTRVLPEYPRVARTMGIRGSVRVEAVVAPNGSVKSLEVKGGHPILAQAAADAVHKWKWAPAVKETKEPVTLKFDPVQ
jgi:TonB family protein